MILTGSQSKSDGVSTEASSASPAIPIRKPASKPDAQAIRAAFLDAARTTALNAPYWQNATGEGLNNESDRRITRNRGRHEFLNNNYAKGLVLSVATNLVGKGPSLSLPDSIENAKQFEKDFRLWARAINLPRKLRLSVCAKLTGGESFKRLVFNPSVRHPVKLDLEEIDARRLDETGMPDSPGVVYDDFGSVLAYRVSPAGNHYGQPETVLAEQMVHWFAELLPGQRRGTCEISPSLDLFHQLRRYTAAVLTAAEVAADNVMVIESNLSAGDLAADEVDPMEQMVLSRGTATTLPFGWKASQMKAEQPVNTYGDFKREILTEAGRGMSVPRNIISGDSSGYNYASGRLDHQSFQQRIEEERCDCEMEVLQAILYAFAKEWSLVRQLPSDNLVDECTWTWPGFPHVDPDKVSKQRERDLLSGALGFGELYAESGRDWETARKRNAEDLLMSEDDYVSLLRKRMASDAAMNSVDDEDPAQPEDLDGSELDDD